jgi:putative oxygen-independent coproporphyrinogen III oxidase
MAGSGERTVIPLLAWRPAAANPSQLQFRNPPPLSLYVHVPWCVQKCPYCDFNSHALPAGQDAARRPATIPEDDYLTALIADLESALPLVWGRRVHSVFFGGGTPSLLSGEGLDQLLAALRSRLPFLPEAEITLEANPGTVEAGKFAAFHAAGVNRLSLGIQSFNPRHLKAIGRIHDDREARQAIELAGTHFGNVNLDLMYGLPGQTLAEALEDIDAALSFAPAHLSCYQLTIEANTAFARQPSDPARTRQLRRHAGRHRSEAGRAPVTCITKPRLSHRAGQQCRHNLNYWHFGDYLGIGAGAHSKLTLHDRVLRQMRWKRPEQYLAQSHGRDADPAGVRHQGRGSALRVHAQRAAPRCRVSTAQLVRGRVPRLPLLSIESELRQAAREGLIRRHGQHIAPSDHGRRFLNQLLQRFLVDRS